MEVVAFLIIPAKVFASTSDREYIHPLPDIDYILYAFISLLLVLLGGMMSGLTVGLLGIDELALELKLASGTDLEKQQALKVLKVINNHHLLLVTLLLANALAMEALPLFLETIFNSEISLLISVTFVLAFGEVIPQSLFTGPDQIKIAGRCVPFVIVTMAILYPIAFPISKLLDKIFGIKSIKRKLGEEELRTFISIQKHHDYTNEGLDSFQVNMMYKIMDLQKLSTHDIHTPIENIPMVELDGEIDSKLILGLCSSGMEFLTVYKKHRYNVCGTVKVQKIIKSVIENGMRVKDLQLDDFVTVKIGIDLIDCFKEFINYNCEIIFLTDIAQKIVGVVKKSDAFNYVLGSTNVSEKHGIHEISNALIEVLEKKERHNSGLKTEMVKRKERVISH